MSKYERRGPLPQDDSTLADIADFRLTNPRPPATRRTRPDPLEKLRELRERHNFPRKQ